MIFFSSTPAVLCLLLFFNLIDGSMRLIIVQIWSSTSFSVSSNISYFLSVSPPMFFSPNISQPILLFSIPAATSSGFHIYQDLTATQCSYCITFWSKEVFSEARAHLAPSEDSCGAGMLLALSRLKPGMLLNILQCIGESQTQQRIIWFKVSIICFKLLLRNLGKGTFTLTICLFPDNISPKQSV